MIEVLEGLLENFDGQASWTRCFAHILNLVAKTTIKQFDVPKGKADEALDAAEKELRDLAEGVDVEEIMTRAETPLNEDEEPDDVDGLVDERDALDEEERQELDESVRPVRLVLTKVCQSQNQY
jgi:hypothetical protein